MKKIISVVLAVVLLLGAIPVFAVGSETAFEVDSAHKETTTISGDDVNGYTFTLSGTDRARIMSKKAYPIANLSFDFGFKYSGNQYGEFGISRINDVNEIGSCSDENTVIFSYRVAGAVGHIYIRSLEGTEKEIGSFSTEHRPGDGYWTPNISNFSFVENDGHWYLAIDGYLCNNVEANKEYSYIESILGDSIFDNNDEVYLFVGGYGVGTIYFKQLSALSTDGAWESCAVDSYNYTFDGAVREYRGQGNTNSTVHSAIPETAVGDKINGHIVDFTETDGYAQTTEGFDLKNTTFQVAPITYAGNTNNFYYYLGFTADPSEFKQHGIKPSDTIEFRAVSVNGNNQTEGWVFTDASGCLANPMRIYLGKIATWKTHCYENNYNQLLKISFVQAIGADGNLHWYMKTVVSGDAIIVKSYDAATDAYLQFDNIVNKPVYFRMGTDREGNDGMQTASFKMYCKITDAAGNSAWAEETEMYPTISAVQEALVESVKKNTAVFDEVSLETVKQNGEEAHAIFTDYIKLTETAKLWLTEQETAIAEAVLLIVDGLNVEGDINSDYVLDNDDTALIKQAWLEGRYVKKYDFNADGVVDIEDAAYAWYDILAEQTINSITDVLYVKDFGAKGDGITNDGPAIFQAMLALASRGENAKLVFESNKTYYYSDDGMGGDIVFQLSNLKNVHILGDNTTIITEAPHRMIRTNNTVDCSVSGFNFDYGKRPYFVAKNATEIDTVAGTCVMEIGEGMAESYLGLTETGQTVTVKVNGNNGTPFGIIESSVGRYHMFLNKYELVGKDKIKIYFIKSASAYTEAWMPRLATQRLICPTPNVGHAVEHAFHFSTDTNLTVKDVKLYSSCKFAIALSNSEGRIVFDNLDIVPNPALEGTDEETDFTSWRDGWHLKENRSRVIWRNCEATGLQDDIFNVSSSVMWVKEVITRSRINMYWPETGGVFRAKLRKGDKMTIINSDTGEIIAETAVEAVVSQSGSDNIVILADSIDALPEGENIKVLFEGLVAPDSLIRNCNFDGTYRFRGPITITGSTFVCKRMWLDVLTSNWLEAPIPRDILFKDCKILFEDASGKYVHASAYNSNLSENAYHIKNIVFEDCIVNPDCFEIGAGDEVIFKNCTTE